MAAIKTFRRPTPSTLREWDRFPTTGDDVAQTRLARAMGYPPGWRVVRTLVTIPVLTSLAARVGFVGGKKSTDGGGGSRNGNGSADISAGSSGSGGGNGTASTTFVRAVQDRIYAGDPLTSPDGFYNHNAALVAASKFDWRPEYDDVIHDNDDDDYDPEDYCITSHKNKGGQLNPREAMFEVDDRVEVLYDEDVDDEEVSDEEEDGVGGEGQWYEATIVKRTEYEDDIRYTVHYHLDDAVQSNVREEKMRPAKSKPKLKPKSEPKHKSKAQTKPKQPKPSAKKNPKKKNPGRPKGGTNNKKGGKKGSKNSAPEDEEENEEDSDVEQPMSEDEELEETKEEDDEEEVTIALLKKGKHKKQTKKLSDKKSKKAKTPSKGERKTGGEGGGKGSGGSCAAMMGRPRLEVTDEQLELALNIGLPEGWSARTRGNCKWSVSSPGGTVYRSKKAAFEAAGVEAPTGIQNHGKTKEGKKKGKEVVAAEAGTAGSGNKTTKKKAGKGGIIGRKRGRPRKRNAEEMAVGEGDGNEEAGKEDGLPEKPDELHEERIIPSLEEGDPPWRTSGHGHLHSLVQLKGPPGGEGSEDPSSVTGTSGSVNGEVSKVGKVLGWISEDDVDADGNPGFVSASTGYPAALFHIVFREFTQDLEEYELEACLLPTEEGAEEDDDDIIDDDNGGENKKAKN